jgi:hypothetical protein
VSPLERLCRWLLLGYPAWYRRERAEEMLSTLLEASPPGRKWPSFRDARALVAGGLRARGRTWSLSMLWVVIGAGGAIYATVVLSQPDYNEVLLIPPTVEWPGEPQVIYWVGQIAELAWLLLSVPVLVAGFVRLRGWRPRRWVRAAAWAGSWVAGLALMGQAADWVGAGLGETRGVLSVRELAICAAWLLLGGAMTWILAVPPARRSDVPSTSSQASGKARPGARPGKPLEPPFGSSQCLVVPVALKMVVDVT